MRQLTVPTSGGAAGRSRLRGSRRAARRRREAAPSRPAASLTKSCSRPTSRARVRIRSGPPRRGASASEFSTKSRFERKSMKPSVATSASPTTTRRAARAARSRVDARRAPPRRPSCRCDRCSDRDRRSPLSPAPDRASPSFGLRCARSGRRLRRAARRATRARRSRRGRGSPRWCRGSAAAGSAAPP